MITKEMSILDIVDAYSKTEEIFRSYDEIVGKCVMCNHLFDSLEDFAEEYDIDLHDLILKLNKTVDK